MPSESAWVADLDVEHVRAGEVAEALGRDVESVVKALLPLGKRVGREWEVGSAQGEAGKSLKVCMAGSKAGVWSDFATGDGGDMLDLWMAVHGLGIADAMREAKRYLGVQDQVFVGHKPPEYTRPGKPRCTKPKGAALEYLSGERAISEATLQAFEIGTTENAVIFPYKRAGDLLLAKRMKLERVDGKKDVRPTEANCEPCLFGWQAIPDDIRSVVITEGEIDAMSLRDYGVHAMSVPFGGGSGNKQQWIENEYPHLDRFDDIILCFDADECGKKAVAEITERLGRHRVRIAQIPEPHKDANDMLRADVSADVVSEMIAGARTLDPVELKQAADYVEEVIREFYPPGDEPIGFLSPWSQLQGKLLFRPDELTVVNGVNGHGKSQVVGQMCLDAMEQGERVCIASLEIKPKKLLMRLTRQAGGMATGIPSIPFIRSIHQWYSDKVWLFDVVGTTKAETMLDVFSYARRRYGIGVFVIDSLMKCGIGEDDYNGQKMFIERVCDFKNEHDAHVFLVTHSRKGQDEMQPTNKMDVKGSGSITDLADNVLTIWRNKRKEVDIQEAQSKGEEPPEDSDGRPDGLIFCSKQRNGDWEGRQGVWWNEASYQFLERKDGKPKRYSEYSEREAQARR